FVVRDRELAVRGDALLAARIALQMRAEGARTRIRNAAREREIAARDRVPSELLHELRLRLRIARDDQRAAREAIEPVHWNHRPRGHAEIVGDALDERVLARLA